MTFPFLWTNKVKLNTSQNNNDHTHLQLRIWSITSHTCHSSAGKVYYNSLLIFSTLFTFQLYSMRWMHYGEVGLITPRVNHFSCTLSWNCFVFDRRSAWAGLMLLAMGSHSQQRCSTTTKGVKTKQYKRGRHACCYCIIALPSSIHLCSGYSFSLTHSQVCGHVILKQKQLRQRNLVGL